MPLTADDILSNVNVIRNSLIVSRLNISVADTATAIPNTSVPTTLTDASGNPVSTFLGNAPLLLHSLAITYSSTFRQYYSLYTKLHGLNIDNNSFGVPADSTSGFDYVPTGKTYLIPSSSYLDVYAYNSGGATSAGSFNILAIFQKLDTLAPSEQAKL